MQVLAKALVESSRFFNFNESKTLITCHWNDARKFHTDHIIQIFRRLALAFEKLEANGN